MKFKDYYQILGVSETASQDEIKRAYRKKARQFHPDVSKETDAEEKIKEVNEAYEALRDEKRRAEYDQLKKHGYRNGDDFQRPPNWQGSGGFNPSSFGGGEFGDFFESIFGSAMGGKGGFGQDAAGGFGQKPRRRRPQQGDDISLTVMVALNNAYSGGKTNLKIPAGAGQAARTLSVKIPAGVIDGSQLRLRAQGRPGLNGGPAGDLRLNIKLKKHRYFSVDGANISLELPVTPLESVSGLKLKVPTLGGEVAMTIPPGTKSGTRMRLRGRGLPASPVGDQYVVVQLQLPENLSAKALDLLRQFDEEALANPREHLLTEPQV